MSDRPKLPNLENLLQMGINAAQSGNKENARLFLQQVLEADKKNDRAWLWLAYVTDPEDEKDRRRYLKTAMRLNPSNRAAQNALKKLDQAKNAGKKRTMRLGSLALAVLVIFGTVTCLLAIVIS
jgi:Tfp pilus assembly protein PilF